MDLILASTSPYRRQLLERLQIPFRCESPNVDETAHPGESPAALAQRLATAKALDIASTNPGAFVIGSDQVASLAGSCIGKPGSHAAASKQLHDSAGQRVDFYTGLSLINLSIDYHETLIERFSVVFRELESLEIETYLQKEKPYDCAGSFKCEGLGIALFEKMIGDDPTTLVGLPLIATCRLLKAAGAPVLEH
ncbi:septum formation inhibitor Maf [Halieaceae bacterium IMCC8485]|uniref:7-methyl-GTP pyrophosphatase n=1 Tax=Candidatus Seongchinamella marina TaxID=2518990 RepID=A0ABT3STB7_9GAMM|nr:Maf family nucleotide pyrophosphatase [Candidatus Seongchinamella marina]MCX2973114.1 septum formation inhibitor Maf [Candidatus Seongchinamella marina]